MDLEEIYPLHSEASQRSLAIPPQRVRTGNPPGRDTPVVGVPDEAALGEDHRPPAGGELPQRLPHHLLGVAEAVDAGRVDPVHARVDGVDDGLDRIRVVLRPPAEGPVAASDGPGSQADRRDLEIAGAEPSGLHRHPILCCVSERRPIVPLPGSEPRPARFGRSLRPLRLMPIGLSSR